MCTVHNVPYVCFSPRFFFYVRPLDCIPSELSKVRAGDFAWSNILAGEESLHLCRTRVGHFQGYSTTAEQAPKTVALFIVTKQTLASVELAFKTSVCLSLIWVRTHPHIKPSCLCISAGMLVEGFAPSVCLSWWWQEWQGLPGLLLTAVFSTPGRSSFTASGCLRSELLHPVWKSESTHILKDPHFSRLNSRPRPLGHYPELMGVNEEQNADGPVTCGSALSLHCNGLMYLLYCHRCHHGPSVPCLLHLPVTHEKGEGCEIETTFDAINDKIHGACMCNNNTSTVSCPV